MFDNLLPIPFDHQGSVVVKLSGAEGELHATGVGASLTLLGERSSSRTRLQTMNHNFNVWLDRGGALQPCWMVGGVNRSFFDLPLSN